MRYSALLLTLLLFIASVARAQDSLRTRYGVEAGLAINMHTADFRALPDIPSCCPLFSSGTGDGPAVRLLYETPVAQNIFAGVKLGYMDNSVKLSTSEPVDVIVNGVILPSQL
ncbi:MAG TPA: hypothetical protein VFA55_07185, partial [Candidatus Kapabacteria bacterium]|nr:hypothetical protein [Candidatus Kapabacteria bacterium]